MKKLAFLMAIVLGLSFGLVACAGPAASTNSINFNLASEPPEMNSILTTSTGSMNIMRHIMEGLVILDQKDAPVPAIAQSWEISEDGLTYTFKLREDVKWSNGEMVTAKDFMFAWNQLFTAETAAEYAPSWASYIVGAEDMLANGTPAEGVGYTALDDYTIEIKLVRPCTFFLSILAFPNFMPVNEKAYAEMGGLGAYGTEAELFCTNGPYLVESWSHEDQFVIKKNPEYYGAADIKIEEIKYSMISDSTTAYNEFKAGNLDMITLNAEKSEMAVNDGYKIQSYDDGSNWYFEFNTKVAGLNNAKVRKAITLGVDAQAFVDTLVKNDSTVANSFTPGAIVNGAFTQKVGKLLDREAYAADDYAMAKALLAEGLAEEGLTVSDLKISLVCDDTDTAGKYNAFFQEQLKTHLGVEVQVQQMTYKARLQLMQDKDFDGIVFAGWGPDYNDPMTFMDLWLSGGGNNHTSWANAEYDALIAAAVEEADADARDAILIEAEKLLMEELPIGPVYNRKGNFITSERLTGVVRTAFDDLNFRWASIA